MKVISALLHPSLAFALLLFILVRWLISCPGQAAICILAGECRRLGKFSHSLGEGVPPSRSGNIVGKQRYYPFGETRLSTGTMYTDKLFTGQRALAGLGIYHYGARFYSPYINRFLSADTIVPGYVHPQNLNRYSYVNNNPLRYIDPTGHMMTYADGGGGGSYRPPSPVNYCTTHPQACRSNNNHHNGNNNQTSISNSTVSIPVGVSSSYSPATSSYGQQAEEGSCGGCSIEPMINPANPFAANPFDLFDFGGQWGINYLAVNSQDIPVYVNMTPNANGSVSVQSIPVDNTHTGLTVAVVQVKFETSGDTSGCFSSSGSCVTNAPYGYSVQSQPGIHSSDLVMPGIGAVTQPNSMQVVTLIPSGYPNNPTNTFTNNFDVKVVLGNSLTGNVYNPISITIHR